MITIPKKVEYSLVFINFLHNLGDKSVSLSKAANNLVLPYRFLGQIAVDLKQAGILTSKEGKNGGYCLAKPWKDKTVYDLIDALGEKKEVVRCEGCGRSSNCRIKRVMNEIEDSFLNELKKIKLSNL